MGLNRLVRRKNQWIVQYLALLVFLYFVYCFVSSPEEVPSSEGVGHSEGQSKNVWSSLNDNFKSVEKRSWEEPEKYAEEMNRKGPGEQGQPLKLPTDAATQEKAQKLYRANGYNALVSDLIPLDRSIKDLRHRDCKAKKYTSKLPTVSVIFPFHEEHNSTLLRSVYSIINRSPPELLKEIILVDDFSEKEALLKPFEDFLKEHDLDKMVKIIRNKKREGLIRARQFGAQAAVGDVLIFLDAHSEASYNWLPPLLEPIAEDYKTVVCPFVDVIDCETYEVKPQDEGARGSFDWGFNYKRLPLLKADRQRPTEPFASPVMAGGYFAISAKWFWELGGYDDGLDIWGGEQYELSFKIWQCHGKMVDAPCSRVAHIYRCKYMPFKNAGKGDFVSRNYKRVAEVWMDEYKEFLYKHRTGVERADAGNLTRMLAVRENLQCKSFDWFMKEVAFDQDKYYPAVEPKASAQGEIRHVASNLCVDTQFKTSGQRFGLRTCTSSDPDGGGEQDLRLTRWHDIRPKDRKICFDVSQSINKAPVVLFDCHSMKGNQLFKYRVESSQIFHPVSGQCLEANENGQGFLFMRRCDSGNKFQKFLWKNVDERLLEERQKNEPHEFE